ncbi:MAG: 6-phospho-beta-glucosidase [Tissierellaceae bacterium]
MKRGLKIAVIGGGSSYTPEFLEGLIKRYDELPVEEIWLVDIEEGLKKLEIIGSLARRMFNKVNIPIEVYTTLNLDDALKGADFVTTQLRVGQLKARERDEKIPLSYGIIGQETVGAGGLFKGLRTIPIILNIANKMHEFCPEAWLINFTNPVGMVTEALSRYSNHRKFIGLCNVPISMERDMADILEIDSSRIRIDFARLNHLVYGFNIYIDDEDKTKEVFQRYLENSQDINMRNIDLQEWDREFLTALNLVPCPYHKYYYKTKDMLENQLEQFKAGRTRALDVMDIEKDLFNIYRDPEVDEKPEQLEQRGGAYYSDVACNLISSIYNDKGDIQVVNTLNNGTIKDFSDEYAIEISSYITKSGPIPCRFIDEFPIEIKGLIQQIKICEILGAKSAMEGDYYKGIMSMCLNPLVQNDSIGRKVFDEMLIANREYLTNFFSE